MVERFGNQNQVERPRAVEFSAIWVQLNEYEDGCTAVLATLDGLVAPPAVVRRESIQPDWRL
jgi:hypothetical protein